MRRYSQLTQEQRCQIYAFLKADFLLSAIAKEIGVHKSTISRELNRKYEIIYKHLRHSNKKRKKRYEDAGSEILPEGLGRCRCPRQKETAGKNIRPQGV